MIKEDHDLSAVVAIKRRSRSIKHKATANSPPQYQGLLSNQKEMADSAIDHFLERSEFCALCSVLGFSERERDITYWILQAAPEAMVAEKLGISPHTVHSHLERLYRKLEINSRSELIIRVFQVYVRLHTQRSER